MRPELSLHISPQQRQELSLRLAPQIIQSIEILQMTTMDLAGLVKMELEENPALEMGTPAKLEETGRIEPDTSSKAEDANKEDRVGEGSQDFEKLDTFETDERWRDSFYDGPPMKRAAGEDKKHEALQNTAAAPQSLNEALLEQFTMLDLTDLQRIIGEQVIYNIDTNGYLRYRLENIVDDLPRDLDVPGVEAPCDDEKFPPPAGPSERARQIADAAAQGDGSEGEDNADAPAGAHGTDPDPNGVSTSDSALPAADDGKDGNGHSLIDPGDLDESGLDRGVTGMGLRAQRSTFDPRELVEPGQGRALKELDELDDLADVDVSDGEAGEATADSNRKKKKGSRPFEMTPSGRYRRRQKESEAPELHDVVPMEMPPLAPLRHPRDEYFEALLFEADEVLGIIRTLDPPGVGAYDLVECLELQIMPDMPHASIVRRLVTQHLEDLQKNRLPRIAKATGHTIDEIKEAMESLALLDPRPGSIYGMEETAYVTPDVVIAEVDDTYQVIVEDNYIPQLRVSKRFDEIMRDTTQSKEAREFARDRISKAMQLQESIEQRRNTLQKVAQTIIDYQKNFFEKGVVGLVPLKMQDVADKIGVHVSTVSRAVSEKYMETPRGIYPMKYFFRGGTQTADGGEENTEIVKQRVREIVDAEPGDSPLSDDAIAAKLSEEFGLAVARRTVTKYRKQLGIPSSRQRKEY